MEKGFKGLTIAKLKIMRTIMLTLKELNGRVSIKAGWFMADWAQMIVKDQDADKFFSYILFIINSMSDSKYQSVECKLENS
jgi:hypothetical protein